MMVLIAGSCWVCGVECEGHWCSDLCLDTWEQEVEWNRRAELASVMGMGVAL